MKTAKKAEEVTVLSLSVVVEEVVAAVHEVQTKVVKVVWIMVVDMEVVEAVQGVGAVKKEVEAV